MKPYHWKDGVKGKVYWELIIAYGDGARTSKTLCNNFHYMKFPMDLFAEQSVPDCDDENTSEGILKMKSLNFIARWEFPTTDKIFPKKK